MKFCLTILILAITQVVNAQTTDTVSLKILHYKTAYIDNIFYPDFELMLTNNNKSSLKLPSTFSASATRSYSPISNLIAEVEFLDEEDCDPAPTRVNCCYFGSNKMPPTTLLQSGDSINISTGIGCYFFKEKGNYRIKFRLDTEKTGIYGKTDWFHFAYIQ